MLITDISINNPKGVIHIGAHKGEERGWYKEKGFKKVLWVEPNSNVFATLEKNIQGYSGHYAINKAIGIEKGKFKLNIANNGQSSSFLELGLHKEYYPKIHYTHTQEVEVIRGDEIPKLYKYNFLNIDVQGDELNVIKSFGNNLTIFDYIYTEVNFAQVYVNCCLMNEVDEYLFKIGFKRTQIKYTECEWGDALYEKI